jgi:hypothetical protein
MPFVLIGLGTFIILDSQALTPLFLAVICGCLMALIRINGALEELAKNSG